MNTYNRLHAHLTRLVNTINTSYKNSKIVYNKLIKKKHCTKYVGLSCCIKKISHAVKLLIDQELLNFPFENFCLLIL